MNAKRVGLALFGAGILALPTAALAQDDFYASNDIRIVVGYSPGGTNDTYARIVANHLGRHIPGEPAIIVENLPGAGSLTAVRSLDNTAPTDGTVMVAFNPGLIMGGLIDPENVQVDFNDYAFVGNVSRAMRVCYTLGHSGFETIEDVQAADEFIVGSTAPGTGAYIDFAVIANLLDINVRPVLGFTGSADINMALERGEVDGYCSLWSSVPENFKESDDFYPLLRISEFEDPLLADVPYIGDLLETEADQQVLDVVVAGHIIGSPYIVSSEVPEERLTVLRDAFAAMLEDPAFLEETERLNHPVDPLLGQEVQEIVSEIYDADEDLIARVQQATQLEP